MRAPRRVVPHKPFNGRVIKELREKRHLSQEQLGASSGMGKANISKLERSRTYVAISYDNFLMLARALYVAPEELSRRLSEPVSSSPGPSAPPAYKRQPRA